MSIVYESKGKKMTVTDDTVGVMERIYPQLEASKDSKMMNLGSMIAATMKADNLGNPDMVGADISYALTITSGKEKGTKIYKVTEKKSTGEIVDGGTLHIKDGKITTYDKT